MTETHTTHEPQPPNKKQHPFRRAVLRGLAIVMPPLLTIVLFIWAWNTIETYVFLPLEATARYATVWTIWDVRENVPDGVEVTERQGHQYFTAGDTTYVQLVRNKRWIPAYVYHNVEDNAEAWPANQPPPSTAKAYFHQYVRNELLPRSRLIPLFLALFIGMLYLLGKFVAANVGRMIVSWFDALIHRLPVIRNVYSSVKQVTDFVFVEQEIEYTRVVAIEYPRKGIWSLGFVTGESMLDIAAAANEPVLAVLMPTSPMPVTGFTITVRRSEAIDLNITIDQAIQFIVSCGVVVPAHQQQKNNRVAAEIAAAVSQRAALQNAATQSTGTAATGTVSGTSSEATKRNGVPMTGANPPATKPLESNQDDS
ncbi:MAG: DUF502 domain-containing protein [Pirellulaceae bacterium]